MKKPAKNNKPSDEASIEKNKTVKYAVIFIAVVAVVFSAIWFGGELLASEVVISTTPITINGKDRTLKLSEKRSGHNRDHRMNEVEPGTRHYAYYLELSDAANHQSLAKLRFKSPVMKIQSTPVMIARDNGTIWLVSTSQSADEDRRGFILKFSVSDKAIQAIDFELDDKYRIRQVEGDNVFLSEGRDLYSGDHALQGGIYLDLNTENVMDNRKRFY